MVLDTLALFLLRKCASEEPNPNVVVSQLAMVSCTGCRARVPGLLHVDSVYAGVYGRAGL